MKAVICSARGRKPYPWTWHAGITAIVLIVWIVLHVQKFSTDNVCFEWRGGCVDYNVQPGKWMFWYVAGWVYALLPAAYLVGCLYAWRASRSL